MVGWGLDSILTGKFMRVFWKEGFVRALERGRANRYRMITDNCGARGTAKHVGTDEFGNKYFEDIHGDDTNDSFNATRWVEVSDKMRWNLTGQEVCPMWMGWLHRQYDDAPTPENTSF